MRQNNKTGNNSFNALRFYYQYVRENKTELNLWAYLSPRLEINVINFIHLLINTRACESTEDQQPFLSKNIKVHLQQLLKKYPPKEFCLEGHTIIKYSGNSLKKVVKKAACEVKNTKNLLFNTLCHSIATSLLKEAIGIRYIQKLPMHNIIKPTKRYTIVANTIQKKIVNVLEKLKVENKIPKTREDIVISKLTPFNKGVIDLHSSTTVFVNKLYNNALQRLPAIFHCCFMDMQK